MSKVNVRELARNTSRVIDGVSKTGQPALVTRDGLPVAAIIPIDAEALDAWILARAPRSVEGIAIDHANGNGAARARGTAKRARRASGSDR